MISIYLRSTQLYYCPHCGNVTPLHHKSRVLYRVAMWTRAVSCSINTPTAHHAIVPCLPLDRCDVHVLLHTVQCASIQCDVPCDHTSRTVISSDILLIWRRREFRRTERIQENSGELFLFWVKGSFKRLEVSTDEHYQIIKTTFEKVSGPSCIDNLNLHLKVRAACSKSNTYQTGSITEWTNQT